MLKIKWVNLLIAAVGGCLTSVVYMAVVGILSVQATATRGGAVLNLNNIVVGVQDPKIPALQMTAIMCMGVLTAYIVAYAPRNFSLPVRLAVSTSFVVSSGVLLIINFSSGPGRDPLQSVADGTMPGIKGWLLKASNESSVHLLVALVLFLVVFQLTRSKARNS